LSINIINNTGALIVIDLNRIGGGRKLIKEIVKQNKQSNAPWSRKNQINKYKVQKNPNPPKI
jgi:hypothetical protein